MTTSPPTVRTFFAVEVSPEIHATLVALKRDLAATGAAVRWVRDEGLHATVKFLGAVPAAQLPELQAALCAPAGARPAMTAGVRGLGVFPTARRPRVVWAGLDCPPLAELAAALDDALAPFGFAPEARAFRAHITFGRVTDTHGWARLDAALRAHATTEFGACRLTELIAYRSDLRRGGSVYTKLWTIPFGG
jgi:2'-5' RNA ligase